jgi:hypothetical protein
MPRPRSFPGPALCRLVLVIPALLAGALLAVGPARAALVTWQLADFGPFTSGQTATGFFTLDQNTGFATNWDVRITGGTRPILTNLVFTPATSFPIGPGLPGPGLVIMGFNMPFDADNIFRGMSFFLDTPRISDLLFPTATSLPAFHLPMPLSGVVAAVMQIAPTEQITLGLDRLDTTAVNARIELAPRAQVREPSVLGTIALALTALGILRIRRAKLQS